MYLKNEMCKSYLLLPVGSFKHSGIFHNVVEMPSHDINTSVQLQLYSKLLSLDVFKPDNGPFDLLYPAVSAIISKCASLIIVLAKIFSHNMICSLKINYCAPIALLVVIKT